MKGEKKERERGGKVERVGRRTREGMEEEEEKERSSIL